MKPPIKVRKGFNLSLEGAPKAQVSDTETPSLITVYPGEYAGVKARLKVKEGDAVKRGSLLFIDKKNESRRFCSPAGGRISSIVLGKRRVIEQIIIDVDGEEQAEEFKRYDAQDILNTERKELVSHLLETGLLALIKQRPFAGMADPEATPKSIFVNGMNTAPFEADIQVAIQGNEPAFQAGLNALTRLTEGDVHLCLADDVAGSSALSQAEHVKIHSFKGPHPAGNTSVHIAHIDPFRKGDIIWHIKAVDVMLIGKLLLDGAYPVDRVVALGGPSVKETERQYYRLRIGAPLAPFLNGKLQDGQHRAINGDVLSGQQIDMEGSLPFYCSGITVIREDRERHFMGWIAPGLSKYSRSRTFVSTWLGRRGNWDLTSNQNGSRRAMVLTGLYDRYMPLDIMVDFLIRAVLAHDTEEAVALGILETAPEDFALCSFVCPSKIDIPKIIQQGLHEIEKEGL